MPSRYEDMDTPMPDRIVDPGAVADDLPLMRRTSTDTTQHSRLSSSAPSIIGITSVVSESLPRDHRIISPYSFTRPGDAFICDIIDIDQDLPPEIRCIAIIFNLAVLLYLDGNVDACNYLLEEQLEEPRHDLEAYAHHHSCPYLFAKISNNIGYLYMIRGDYHTASTFLVSSLIEYWTLVGDENVNQGGEGGMISARIMFGIAKAQYNLGLFDDCADNYSSAMSLWNNLAGEGHGCHAAPAA